MAMLMVKNPRDFNGVIHTDNTFGDILSYISGGLVGSLGSRPSASISGIPGQGKRNGIYEPARVGVPLVLLVKALSTQSPRYNSISPCFSDNSCLLVKGAAAIETAVQRVFESKDAGGLIWAEVQAPLKSGMRRVAPDFKQKGLVLI
ncbi:hypothetical protein C2857_002771 [Epichloe festucae Fl1]|uniref:Isopropylmalate dehydrogenase-like domain-containing protein n=1 Tax=Epichloe festucae (strain Fl1) TaxID=877507 RepID=A0A7U3SN80_EPIFF|nr:hypothetical protein C2857_002771 [Epichloe festucae Fl1]